MMINAIIINTHSFVKIVIVITVVYISKKQLNRDFKKKIVRTLKTINYEKGRSVVKKRIL